MMTEGAAGAGAGPLAAPPLGVPASAAPGRRGKLPPSPASTFMRPQQLLQRQRAAERAAMEQDAAVLAQLLGGGEFSPVSGRPEHSTQPEASSIAGPERPAATASGATMEGGSLTGATLQALTMDQPGCLRQGHGRPESGLSAEPSVLSSYIAGIEEDSRLAQRQLTHLQASTSGGGGRGPRAGGWAAVGAPPPPLRSARGMPGRREVFVLSKWLEVSWRRQAAGQAPGLARAAREFLLPG